MTRGQENGTSDTKIKVLGWLLRRKEEQGEKCKVLCSARSDAFTLVGILAGRRSGTSFLLYTSCSSGLPCQTQCWLVGSGISAGGEKWSESAGGDGSLCP